MAYTIREILKDDQFSGVEFVKTFFNLSSLSKDQNFVISVAKLPGVPQKGLPLCS